MKFFIRQDGVQKGPFSLEELSEAGVTPDTYVWTKGMADWEQARTQPDICRYFRRRLSGTLPLPERNVESVDESGRAPNPVKMFEQGEKVSLNDIMRFVNQQAAEAMEEKRNPTRPPRTSLLSAVCAIIVFFPTGIAALLQTLKARKLWLQAPAGDAGTDLRRLSHDCANSAHMWAGISLFLGIILWTAIISSIIS